jgi:protein ImuB
MYGCIHVPDFAVQAALQQESKEQPVALLEGSESLLKVVACNNAARREGVLFGMTKLQVETCRVTLRKRVQEEEDIAQAVLTDCAYHFSPRVEATHPGTVIFDLAGSERLLGADNAIAALVRDQVTDRDFESNVSIAANPDAAYCAARGFEGITVIEDGEEAQRLSSLPIAALELEPEVLSILHAWGIRNFKSLAALPTIPLSERLGQYGLHLQRLARGIATRELVPADVPTLFRESLELEETVELLEPLGFVLNRLLEQVIGRLRDRSLATDHIEIELALELPSDREINTVPRTSAPATYQRRIKLPVPTQDTKVLLKLAQLDLAAHPPHAPVKKVSVEAMPTRIRFTQADLFQPAAPEAAKLEITLARVRAVVGEADSQSRKRVGFPRLIDSHRPDHFEIASTGGKNKAPSERQAPQLALRRFRPALAARVELNAGQVPVGIAFQRRKGKVINAAGPWRRGGEWWDVAGKWMREEWDIHLTIDGASALYRLYRDVATKQWFVEGMYD